MNHPETIIEIEDLTKDYEVGFLRKKTVRALDHLSLEVRRGEIFGFLGPNGAGKTTTLKLLMRLIYPTAGNARILGRLIDDTSTHSRIGYLPENPYFYDYLSGRELLEYSAALFGIPATEARERASTLLNLVGLEDERADRQLRKYSKGMLQRIGIAQALVNEPDIVFMDEPMSGLDPVGRREVRDLMLALRDRGKTVFFSSHILSDVEILCDRAAILSRGKLIRCGTMTEMTGKDVAAYEIVARGIEEEDVVTFSRSIAQAIGIRRTPDGVTVTVSEENAFGEIIDAVHRFHGKIVSISPRRASLEDLFSASEKGDRREV